VGDRVISIVLSQLAHLLEPSYQILVVFIIPEFSVLGLYQLVILGLFGALIKCSTKNFLCKVRTLFERTIAHETLLLNNRHNNKRLPNFLRNLFIIKIIGYNYGAVLLSSVPFFYLLL
jgi:hypothetical protein